MTEDTATMGPDSCALCGWPTHGDFYVGVPGHPGSYMHTVNCGPVLVNDIRREPTHERAADGTIRRRP